MSTQKQKFELISRLQALGFTYEEAQTLRRAQLTLRRWAEAECNGEIERDEETGKPFYVYRGWTDGGKVPRYRIADREAGALRRVKAVVDARNARERSSDGRRSSSAGHILFYHQTDPRGCALYLVPARELEGDEIVRIAKEKGCRLSSNTLHRDARDIMGVKKWYIPSCKEGFECPEAAALRWFKLNHIAPPDSRNLPIDQYYTRGLAVCC